MPRPAPPPRRRSPAAVLTAAMVLAAAGFPGGPARAEDPPPAPAAEPSPPPPAPPAAEGGPPRADAAAAATAPRPGPTPEARVVIEAAARAQGTLPYRGASAVRRFRVAFSDVVAISPRGDRVTADTVETFALPGMVRSEWTVDAKRQVLGHNGRVGWLREGEGEVRRFTDPEGRDRESLRDLDLRRRMLRLALRVFFLGNLLDDGPEVARLADEAIAIPRFNGSVEKPRTCRVLRRAADAEAGDPALTLWLDAETGDPVAARLEPAEADAARFLLTFDPPAEPHAKGAVPEGLRVPGFLEVFEVPAEEGAKPAPRITARLASLVIDAAAIPDADFSPPRPAPPR